VVPQIANYDFFYSGAEIIDDICQQIVRHRACWLDAFQPTVNSEDFDYADNDRETSIAVTLFEHYHLLIGHFVYDNAR